MLAECLQGACRVLLRGLTRASKKPFGIPRALSVAICGASSRDSSVCPRALTLSSFSGARAHGIWLAKLAPCQYMVKCGTCVPKLHRDRRSMARPHVLRRGHVQRLPDERLAGGREADRAHGAAGGLDPASHPRRAQNLGGTQNSVFLSPFPRWLRGN